MFQFGLTVFIIFDFKNDRSTTPSKTRHRCAAYIFAEVPIYICTHECVVLPFP